jgi:Spy/CpxP family protein refolding chaperone
MNTYASTATAAVLLIASLSSVQAATCQDVRALSPADQEYWSKRLNLTASQRNQIWVACYRRHSRAHLGDPPRGLPAEGQQDTSTGTAR